MQKVHCEISGLAPYYFNKYVSENPGKSEKAEKEHAFKKVFLDGNDCLSFPGIQIQGCIIAAISLAQMKMGASMKRPIDFIESTFQKPELIQFIPKKDINDIELVKERTRVKSGKEQKLRENWYTRLNPQWEAEFDIQFGDILPITYIEEALKTGGQFCGIGGRRNWQRGRFEVVKFESMLC